MNEFPLINLLDLNGGFILWHSFGNTAEAGVVLEKHNVNIHTTNKVFCKPVPKAHTFWVDTWGPFCKRTHFKYSALKNKMNQSDMKQINALYTFVALFWGTEGTIFLIMVRVLEIDINTILRSFKVANSLHSSQKQAEQYSIKYWNGMIHIY